MTQAWTTTPTRTATPAPPPPTGPVVAVPPLTPLGLEQVDAAFFQTVAAAAMRPPVKVFGAGASRQVFLFTRPGGGSAVVKVMPSLHNEAVVANNMLNFMNSCRAEDSTFRAVAPRSRVADAAERDVIAAAIATIPDPDHPDQGTSVDPRSGLLVSELLPGAMFRTFVATEPPPPPKASPKVAVQRWVAPAQPAPPTVLDLVAEREPWYVLATVYVVDVVLGMRDHFTPQYNSENFLYDAASSTFGFIDNIKGSESIIYFDPRAVQAWEGFSGFPAIRAGKYGDAATLLFDGVKGARGGDTGIMGDLKRAGASKDFQDRVDAAFTAQRGSILEAMTGGIADAVELWTGVTDGVTKDRALDAFADGLIGVEPGVKALAAEKLFERLVSLRPPKAPAPVAKQVVAGVHRMRASSRPQ